MGTSRPRASLHSQRLRQQTPSDHDGPMVVTAGDVGASHSVLDQLRVDLGEGSVLTDPDVLASHGADWTGRWSVPPVAVLRPRDTADVVQIIRTCAALGVPVVPQGGRTSLVGGSIPTRPGSVVLSTARLRSLQTDGSTLLAGAGVTLQAVQEAARTAGRAFGVDLAARGTATVGGMVATDAGGLHVVAHGTMGAQVLGLTAVLGSGEVVGTTSPLAKTALGPSVIRSLVGSEGTLGVITAVRLRMVPTPANLVTAVVPMSLAEALALLPALRDVPDLHAVEYVDAGTAALVGAPGEFLLVEGGEELAGLLPDHALVALDAAARRRLWAWREGASEAAATASRMPLVKLDVALPHHNLEALVQGLPAPALVFGHLAEGNLHVQLLDRSPADGDSDAHAVLRLVGELGGAISSEHGVGRAKTAELGWSLPAGDIAALQALKKAWDPAGVLNPGILLPAPAADH